MGGLQAMRCALDLRGRKWPGIHLFGHGSMKRICMRSSNFISPFLQGSRESRARIKHHLGHLHFANWAMRLSNLTEAHLMSVLHLV
jgi:hypothetical protein